MNPGPQGSVRIFRVFGVDVYVHWAWLFVAYWQISSGRHLYDSVLWNVAQYLTLFLIVLIHEFGHALATRQVGGTANQILLWPFGGVAYVSPPPRPGAELWSIAAGPLVNVVLFCVLTPLLMANDIPFNPGVDLPDPYAFARNVWLINTLLLIFNMLPVYPLDGDQIFRALLWFLIGRARSMYVAVVVGFVGVGGLALLALWRRDLWLGLITAYVFQNCRRGWAHAQALSALERQPRRTDYACPACRVAPPIGPLWRCPQCGTAFDTFETQAVCPNCHVQFPATRCLDCHVSNPIANWRTR